MKTEIRYFTKSKKGNTEKLASRIARATGKPTEDDFIRACAFAKKMA